MTGCLRNASNPSLGSGKEGIIVLAGKESKQRPWLQYWKEIKEKITFQLRRTSFDLICPMADCDIADRYFPNTEVDMIRHPGRNFTCNNYSKWT